MRRIYALLLGAILALPACAGLPSFRRPPRPVTDLRCVKSGSDVVLTWTTSPSGTYAYLVCRGLLAPEFKQQKVVAWITDGSTTWTDVGAITRTILGVPVNEFYMVYALPWPGRAPLAHKAFLPEWHGRPRDGQQTIRLDVTNAVQFPGVPKARVLEEGEAGITMATSAGDTAYLLDMLNRPTPGLATGTVWVNANRFEQYPGTVDHAASMAGVLFTPNGGNQTITTATARTIPTPALGARTGNRQTVSWTWPTEDTPGAVVQVQLWRSYEGVGDGEDAVLVGTYTSATTQTVDDLSAVPPGWYVFYQLKLVYVDGTTSPYGPSSAPVQR